MDFFGGGGISGGGGGGGEGEGGDGQVWAIVKVLRRECKELMAPVKIRV